MAEASLGYVKSEFAVTLGYIRQDIRWLLERDSGLNYTIGLLIGCGCEMLAAYAGDKKRLGEKMFAERGRCSLSRHYRSQHLRQPEHGVQRILAAGARLRLQRWWRRADSRLRILGSGRDSVEGHPDS
jgi:hypothetical protein